MSVTTISGIRDLAPEARDTVEMAVLEEISSCGVMRFGGAIGVDTVALQSACGHVCCEVFVPFTIADQPRVAQETIRRCATCVHELHASRSKSAYQARNLAMLAGAHKLLAFSDGREHGGTYNTVLAADRMGIEVVTVPVAGGSFAFGGLVEHPFVAPVHYFKKYISERSTGIRDPTSDLIRRMKMGAVAPEEEVGLALKLAAFVRATPDLRDATAILPLPRQVPSAPSDLAPLARVLAKELGMTPICNCLRRVRAPMGGRVRAYRMRFTPEQHFDSLEVTCALRGHHKVILLDNVVAFGGTMEGALMRILEGTDSYPVGLAILRGGST